MISMFPLWQIPAFSLAVIALLTAIFKALKWFYELSKDLEEGVQYLRHEMELNSGKTMRDAIDRIENRQLKIESIIHEHYAVQEERYEQEHP